MDKCCGKDDVLELKKMFAEFHEAMLSKAVEKHYEGYQGWDSEVFTDVMMKKLHANIERGRWVNVANLAAFMWNLDRLQNNA